jgi:hypothetical protein
LIGDFGGITSTNGSFTSARLVLNQDGLADFLAQLFREEPHNRVGSGAGGITTDDMDFLGGIILRPSRHRQGCEGQGCKGRGEKRREGFFHRFPIGLEGFYCTDWPQGPPALEKVIAYAAQNRTEFGAW